MPNQTDQQALIALKKRLRLLIIALVASAVLLFIFVGAAIFFYQLHASSPVPKAQGSYKIYNAKSLALLGLQIKNLDQLAV